MARGKKQGGAAPSEERRKRVSPSVDGPRACTNGKKRRHVSGNQAPAANAPSAAFLAALEAQRAKQSATQESTATGTSASAHAVTTSPTTLESVYRQSEETGGPDHETRARAALPGFYYDEAKGRYFKLTKQLQQQQQQNQRRAEASAIETSKRSQKLCTLMTQRPTARHRGWIAYLAERQLLAVGAVQHRELVPRFFASRFNQQGLVRLETGINATRDRFSAMDISPDSSRIFLGYATGSVRSFTLSPSTNDTTESLVALGSVDTVGMTVSSIRHHHHQKHGILVSTVGASVSDDLVPLMLRGGGREGSGRVGLFSEPTLQRSPHVWRLNDPWVVEWSPQQANLFSVGLGGQQGAGLIDCTASRDGQVAMMAPQGRIKSDTLSQAFSQHASTVIVNGSRNGSWWSWDTRAPRRATEVLASNDKTFGSIQCMRLLRDDRRLVTQRSDGELAVIDLRSPRHATVTRICPRERGAYKYMLRFDVDESESVVATASTGFMSIFDLSRGTEQSHLSVTDSERHGREMETTQQHPVEQVILRETNSAPTVWGLSRSAVFRTQGQSLR